MTPCKFGEPDAMPFRPRPEPDGLEPLLLVERRLQKTLEPVICRNDTVAAGPRDDELGIEQGTDRR